MLAPFHDRWGSLGGWSLWTRRFPGLQRPRFFQFLFTFHNNSRRSLVFAVWSMKCFDLSSVRVSRYDRAVEWSPFFHAHFSWFHRSPDACWTMRKKAAFCGAEVAIRSRTLQLSATKGDEGTVRQIAILLPFSLWRRKLDCDSRPGDRRILQKQIPDQTTVVRMLEAFTNAVRSRQLQLDKECDSCRRCLTPKPPSWPWNIRNFG